MKNNVLALLLAASLLVGAQAQEMSKTPVVKVRAGYNIGGTMPVGMPASIRSLNSYTPQVAPAVGADVLMPFNERFAWQAGLRIERKAMHEDATVKNYHMELVRGGERLSGMFTGRVTTRASQWVASLPVQAVWHVNKVNLKFGPYFAWCIDNVFDGWAHRGYLRVDDPTGAKIELGEEPDERGDYDFSEDLRRWQVGLNLGADWNLGGRFGLYADLNWGLSTAFKSNFHTIEQSMYPIYAQLGVTYRIK
ncbi:MAG: PorT family protein [Muribaculaceae bacterium]|nr:PorT family protein [Muribaculaceae bacterium]